MSQSYDLLSRRGNVKVRLTVDKTIGFVELTYTESLKHLNVKSVNPFQASMFFLGWVWIQTRSLCFRNTWFKNSDFSTHFMDFEQNWITTSTQSSSSTSDPSMKLRATIDQAVLQVLWNCNICFEKAWGSNASATLFLINKLLLALKH